MGNQKKNEITIFFNENRSILLSGRSFRDWRVIQLSKTHVIQYAKISLVKKKSLNWLRTNDVLASEKR